ncbi:hypothetical protein [Streptomyces sp. NPDC086989]|uniref:hypothetical protein n=1 Tax=Streptomyces sp. NPDC086989 TaxID=3365764 RepID=UPI00380D4E9F
MVGEFGQGHGLLAGQWVGRGQQGEDGFGDQGGEDHPVARRQDLLRVVAVRAVLDPHGPNGPAAGGKKPGSTAVTERFTRCDTDVVNVDRLPFRFDAELPRVLHEVVAGLDQAARTVDSRPALARLRGWGAAARRVLAPVTARHGCHWRRPIRPRSV